MASPRPTRTRSSKANDHEDRRVTSFSLRAEVLEKLRAMSARDDLSQAQILSRLIMAAP